MILLTEKWILSKPKYNETYLRVLEVAELEESDIIMI